MSCVRTICEQSMNDTTKQGSLYVRAHSGIGLNEWEMMLQCNVVSHWLNAYLEWTPLTGCYVYMHHIGPRVYRPLNCMVYTRQFGHQIGVYELATVRATTSKWYALKWFNHVGPRCRRASWKSTLYTGWRSLERHIAWWSHDTLTFSI